MSQLNGKYTKPTEVKNLMAQPQLEDGHTRIANEILEHLIKLHLSPNQWQVLLCIIRKTYGFQKKVDYIANSQIIKDTGLCKAVVSRALKQLAMKVIITRNGKSIGLQKDWEQWQKLAKQLTIEKLAIPSTELAIPSTELAEQSTKVSRTATQQKKKETIQKKLYKRKYGEFQNVLLTDEEYQKLQDRFKATIIEKIENLSTGIASRGYKYKSHYATLLNWERLEAKRQKEQGNGTTRGNHALAGQSGSTTANPQKASPFAKYG